MSHLSMEWRPICNYIVKNVIQFNIVRIMFYIKIDRQYCQCEVRKIEEYIHNQG